MLQHVCLSFRFPAFRFPLFSFVFLCVCMCFSVFRRMAAHATSWPRRSIGAASPFTPPNA
jgi:hypothetical protein